MTTMLNTRRGLRSIRTTYRGTIFRSRLEADWAATFDTLGWYWQYEPVPIELAGTAYLPDFYLPKQRTWFEAKGPFADRLDKTNLLNTILRKLGDDELVVIGRPAGPGRLADFTIPDTVNVGVFTCERCHEHCFVAPLGTAQGNNTKPSTRWQCRNCHAVDAIDPFSRLYSATALHVLEQQTPGITSAMRCSGLPFANHKQAA